MKRLFLLIPVLALSLMAGAKTINITPTSPHSSGNNLLATLNDASTVDGDVIILADGTYSEYNNYIVFDKSVEVKAAEGAHPVVEVECEVRIGKNASGKNITIRGIKFDGSKQDGTGNNATPYSHFFRIYSAGTLDFEDCEFYSSANKVIEVESTSSVADLVINNCYFHDNTKSCIYIDNTVASNLTITNSTFANSTTVSKGTIFSKAGASSIIRVDHCTFYNCTTENTDYGVIGHNGYSPTDVVVSNCIFAWGTEYNKRATYLPSGTSVTNCLTYNTNKDTDKWGHHSGPTFTNCTLQDPLFNDLANNKYTFANDWKTMSISPACGTATDGSDLGDPRWYSDPVVPSSGFASPGYTFLGTKAQLSGSFALNGDNYIQSQDKTYAGVAIWKIEATRKCIVEVTLNISSSNTTGHLYEVALYDSDNALVGTALAEPENSWSAGDKVLGTLEIPAAGIYTIKLTNSCDYSSTIIEGVKFSYVGGAVQDMPGTTDIDDAWFSSGGTRADSKIDFPDGYIQDGWVKWNVAFASAGNYNVTVTIDNENGHNYTVALYRSESDESPITIGEGSQKSTIGTIELGAMEVPAGNYIMKVTNATQYSDAKLISVTFAYEGGAVVNIPNNNIPLTEAILEGGATRDNDGLHFKNAQYVKWNIHATEGLYTFTAHCTSPSTDNYSNLMIKVKQGNTELYSYAPQYHYNQADNEIQSPAWLLDAGDYTLELSNPTSGNGYLTSLAATAASNMFILDDNKTDDGSIAAAAGETYKFLLKRSFTAGRYYTICIPVGSWNDELKLAFGADYELWKMTSAVQNGDAIDLNFEQINGQSFHAGWPYIIKPSVDVQNPVLYNEKTIANSTYNNTQSFDAADFIGTFYKSEIPAGENNLYLQNNNLYYSASSNTTIKGTRAWIRLTQQEGSAPARARIVLGGQVATDINLVNGELINGTVKTIENGQLILIRDGKKYNVMGTRLQ